ncbi:MAG: electron transport complex subunit RsxC [Lachnoclostridium sp.]|nr:electron transport complex subunit RsxC [Lachnoclostridium sp.]
MKLTFKGGIHPYDGKDISKDAPIKEILPEEELIFPMVQHIGAPAVPTVKKGDKVLMGQCIGRSDAFISSDIISSVSGEVKDIKPWLTVSGSKATSIIIKNDKNYTAVSGMNTERDYLSMTGEQIIQAVKDAGIVGAGGAGFPTHVKLSPPNPEKIDTIIVNAAECEPYLTSDYRAMIETPDQIVKGLKVVLHLFPNAKGIIATEDNKPDAAKKLIQAAKGEKKIEIKILKTKYPQGAERQMIYAVTGRQINSSMLPADAGCIVNNVDTIASVYLAVCKNIPFIRRILTVTGDAITNPMNYEIKTGMTYQQLVDKIGGFKEEPVKIISGGPMMGLALFDLNVPITKTSSALLAFTKDEVEKYAPTACIRCGRCVEVCPSKLIPQRMLEYSNAFDDEGFLGVHGMECYECGTCTYVCPAKRRMTQSFKQTRRSILDNRKKG